MAFYVRCMAGRPDVFPQILWMFSRETREETSASPNSFVLLLAHPQSQGTRLDAEELQEGKQTSPALATLITKEQNIVFFRVLWHQAGLVLTLAAVWRMYSQILGNRLVIA